MSSSSKNWTPESQLKHMFNGMLRPRTQLSKRGRIVLVTSVVMLMLVTYKVFLVPKSSPEAPSFEVRLSLDQSTPGKTAPLDTLVETIKAFPGFDGFTTTACETDVSEEFKATSAARYATLRPQNGTKPRTYFFAMNLYNSQHIVPDLIYQLSQVLQHIGPRNAFVSIFENGSTDQTKPLLQILRLALSLLGVDHTIVLSDKPPTSREDDLRMQKLAWTRRQAIKPLLDLMEHKKRTFDYVVFLNDILVCRDNVFELMYQQRLQRSHITCGLDFADVEQLPPDPHFYDTWVARDIQGYEFSSDWNSGVIVDSTSREKMHRNEPFQAYCCWNGMVILDTAPLYKHHVTFRVGVNEDTCSFASECTFICEDFWGVGYGRIVIVPRVKVTYNRLNFDALYRPGARSEIGPRDKPFGDAEDKEITWQERPKEWYCSYERYKWVEGKGVGKKGGRDPYTPSGED